MILKKFLGKTIDAAKKSARQMYGDDFMVMDSSDSDGNSQITVAVDREAYGRQEKHQQTGNNGSKDTARSSGVHFERTSKPEQQQAPSQKEFSRNLEALRRYAEKNEPSNGKNIGNGAASDEPENSFSEKTSFKPSGQNNGHLYSRASIRKPANQDSERPRQTTFKPSSKGSVPENNRPEETPKASAPSERKGGADLLSRFENSGPRINRTTSSVPSPSSRREQREINALHKRFDKLEALLDSSLISSNLDYASHPAFQQLVQTGINTSVVAGWFSEIIREGIDPFSQPEMFMSNLSGLIRDAIGRPTDRQTQKYLLFTGPAGSGKTNLVMKLTQHPGFMKNKNVAVVSINPQTGDQPYYTVLQPFCEDYGIPFYTVKTGVDVTEMQEEWENFDHVLIDSPSVSTQQDHSFRQYWKIRQVLASLKPLEVHYVVNASLNEFYFKDSSANNHPLQPDYMAITHLDEVSKWGPVIPFMKEMKCPARYVSNGDSLPDSLHKFDPAWFAQNVLKN